MTKSYAIVSAHCPDENIPYIRELLSYDVRCPLSCTFARGEFGNILFNYAPSPLHWSRQVEWPWVLREGDFQHGQQVLDIGSGWSILKYAIAKRIKSGHDGENDGCPLNDPETFCHPATKGLDCSCPQGRLIALDNNKEFLERTQPAIDLLNPERNIKQVHGDALALPFEDNTFDRVVCVSVLEHIAEGHIKATQEAIRVLKPGGIALLTMDVVVNGPAGQGNNFYLTKDGAEELVASLGIKTIFQPESGFVGATMDEGVGIVCMMIKYVKEGEFK